MHPIIYFAEGVPAISQERLITDGLGYVFDDYSPTVLATTTGPGKKQGCLFAPARPDLSTRDIRYNPAEQRWVRISEDSRYWCGCWKNKVPGPSDLQRAHVFNGHLVKLSDDNEWTVPVACYMDNSSAFPSKLKRIGNAWGFGEILDQYQDLVKQAEKLLDQFVIAAEENGKDNASIEFTVDAEIDLGIQALSMNYMVGPAEVDLLGLLTDQNFRDIAFALVDVPGMKQIQSAIEKKNTTAATARLGSGNRDGPETTARP